MLDVLTHAEGAAPAAHLPATTGSTSHCTLPMEPFWNHVHTHFQNLGLVQLDMQENRAQLAFNGRVIIKCKGEFVNFKKGSIAALNGLRIHCRQLKNRGALLARGAIVDSMVAAEADHALTIYADRIDNRKGAIESTEGLLKWVSCRHAVLNNDAGTFLGKWGIVRQRSTATLANPSAAPALLVSNRKGQIITTHGLIDLALPYIDNSEGLFQGALKELHVDTFINKHGQLKLSQAAHLTIDNHFDNTHGLVEITGGLVLKNGLWQNTDGIISATLGVGGEVHSFNNSGKGYIFSPEGSIEIGTESDWTQKGRMEALLGLLLQTKSGVYWGQEGLLVTPQSVTIQSNQMKIDLQGTRIHASALKVSAKNQIDLSRSHLELKAGLHVHSQAQWIDAHQIDLAKASGQLIFEAKRSLNIDHSVGCIAGTLIIRSMGANFNHNDLVCMGDVVFEGERFKAQENLLTLPTSNIALDVKRSIYSHGSEMSALQGSITERSQGWISKRGDATAAIDIKRQGEEVLLLGSRDAAKTVKLTARDHLYLQQYDARAESLEVGGAIGLLQEIALDAERITLQTEELWLASATLRYKAAKVEVEKTLAVRQLNGAGETLSLKSKQASVSVHKSRIRTRKTRIQAKKEIDLIGNEMGGSLEQTSKKHQLVANNLLKNGDLILTSSEGNLTVQQNQIVDKESVVFKAENGALSLTDMDIQADNMATSSQHANLQKARLKLRQKMQLSAKQMVAVNLQQEAKESHLQGDSFMHLHRVALSSERGTSLYTDGVALVKESHLLSQGSTRVNADVALIDKSYLSATEESATVATKGPCAIESSKIHAPAIEIQSGFAMLDQASVVAKETLKLKGSFNITASALQSGHLAEVRGERFALDHSQLSVQEGDLAIEVEQEMLTQAQVAARSITESVSRLQLDRSLAVAKYQLKRTADAIYSNESQDVATTIIEQAKDLHHHRHTMQASQISLAASRALSLLQTTTFGNLSASSEGRLSAPALQAFGGQVGLKGGEIDISHAAIHASLSANSQSHLYATQTAVRGGSVQLHAAGQLLAPRLSIKAEGQIHLHAGQLAQLDHSALHTTRALMLDGGSTLDRSHSHVSAGSLQERATQHLSARGSFTKVAGNAEQTCKGGYLDLAHTYTQIEGSLHRSGADINHQRGLSSAWSQNYTANSLNNCTGKMHLGGGVSHIDVGALHNDHLTHYEGGGTLNIDVAGAHIESATFNVGGLEERAHSLELHGSISAGQLKLGATAGNLALHAPLNADIGAFSAAGLIRSYAPLSFTHTGDFTCLQMDNYAPIHSLGGLTFDQRVYKDLFNVHGNKELLFLSDSSIDAHRDFHTPGALGLVSRQGHVRTHAPITAGGDFLANGSSIQINRPLNATGRGLFHSPGQLHFNHTEAMFGAGLDVDVGTYLNDVSHVDVTGQSRILCDNFRLTSATVAPKGWRGKGSAEPYLHTPATQAFHGDLYLQARQNLVNDASNLLVDGNFLLEGGAFQNINRCHEHSYQVRTGSYRSLYGYGRRRHTYAWVHDTVIDGIANTQVGKTFDITLSQGLTNDGVIQAGRLQGSVGALVNGMLNQRGRTPLAYRQPLESMSSTTTLKPGGHIHTESGTDLTVHTHLHNSGYIESAGPLFLQAETLSNIQDKTEEAAQVVGKRTFWGDRKVHYVPTDHLRSGGVIHGATTHLHVGRGLNLGGRIEGESALLLEAQNFTNDAQTLRRAVHLNPGRLLPWQSARGFSTATDFVPGELTSGGNLEASIEHTYHSRGSNMTAFGDLDMTVGELKSETLFDSHISADRRAWNKSQTTHTLTSKEPHIRAISGDLHVTATKGDLQFMGEVGSYGGNAHLQSACNILFKAETIQAQNENSRLSITPTTISSQTTAYNTTLSSTPHFFAGGGSLSMLATGSIEGEALQLTAAEDLIAKAKSLRFQTHAVERYSNTCGVTLGASFFGSRAIEALAAGKSFGNAARTLLEEDPAIASAIRLAGAKGGLALALQGATTAIHGWQAATQLGAAHRAGHLQEATGERLGLTDSKGNFNPRISVRLGSYHQEAAWTQHIPSTASVGGNIDIHTTGTQDYIGWDVQGIGGGMTLKGEKISFEAPAERFSQTGTSCGMSISYGPRGFDVGLDYAQQRASSTAFRDGKLDAGKSVRIIAEALSLKGVALEADVVDIDAKTIELTSVYDESSSRQVGGSLSTSFDGAFSYAKSDTRQISTVAGVVARKAGSLKADHLSLKGASVHALELDVKELAWSDLPTYARSHSIALSGNVKAAAALANGENEPQGVSLLGQFGYSHAKQHGVVRATISGDSGFKDRGINTDVAARRQVGKTHAIDLSVPLFALDSAAIKDEAAALKAQNRSPVKRHVEMQKEAPQATAASLPNGEGSQSSAAEQKQNEKKKASPKRTPAQAGEESTDLRPSAAPQPPPNTVAATSAAADLAEEPFEQRQKAFMLKVLQKHFSKTQPQPQPTDNALDKDKLTSQNTAQKLSLVQTMERSDELDRMLSVRIAAIPLELMDHAVKLAVDKLVVSGAAAIDLTADVGKGICYSHPALEGKCRQLQAGISAGTRKVKQTFVTVASSALHWVKEAGEAIHQTGSAICHSHPTLANTCQQSKKNLSLIYQTSVFSPASKEANAARNAHLQIPQETTLQYHQDVNRFALAMGFGAAGKAFSTLKRAVKSHGPAYELILPGSNDLRGVFAKDVTPKIKLFSYRAKGTLSTNNAQLLAGPHKPVPKLKLTFVATDAASKTAPASLGNKYFLNRKITKKTKIVPEDVGISTSEYLKGRPPHPPFDSRLSLKNEIIENRGIISYEHLKSRRPIDLHPYSIRGWLKLEKDVLKVSIEMLRVPEGRLGNGLKVMSNFKEIAKANHAKTLQIEAEIVNEKLLDVMTKRYGTPSVVEGKRNSKTHTFMIDVETKPTRGFAKGKEPAAPPSTSSSAASYSYPSPPFYAKLLVEKGVATAFAKSDGTAPLLLTSSSIPSYNNTRPPFYAKPPAPKAEVPVAPYRRTIHDTPFQHLPKGFLAKIPALISILRGHGKYTMMTTSLKEDRKMTVANIHYLQNIKTDEKHHFHKTIAKLKQEALENGSSILRIEFEAENDVFLKLAKKKRPDCQYMGTLPVNFLGQKSYTKEPFHAVEITIRKNSTPKAASQKPSEKEFGGAGIEKVTALFEQITTKPSNSAERQKYLKEACLASSLAGQSLSAMQNMGLEYEVKATKTMAEEVYNAFQDNLQSVSKNLTESGLPALNLKKKDLKALRRDFYNAPGPVSFGSRDKPKAPFAEESPLVLPAEPAGIALNSPTDFSHVLPRSLTGREFASLDARLQREAFTAGLQIVEVEMLKNNFAEGYAKSFQDTVPAAAKAFYALHSSVEVLSELSVLMKEDRYTHLKEQSIPRLVEAVNLQFSAFQQNEAPKGSLLTSVQNIVRAATAPPPGATEAPLCINVYDAMEGTAVPFYGKEGVEPSRPIEIFMRTAVQNHSEAFIDEENFRLLSASDSLLYHVKDKTGQTVAVVKEFMTTSSTKFGFIPEVVALEYLLEANLKHSLYPQVLEVGKYTSKDGFTRGLIAYNYTSGHTIEILLKEGLEVPTKKIGYALGEINAIGSAGPVLETYLDSKLCLFKVRASSVLDKLSQLGASANFSMQDIESIATNLKANPGQPGVVHGDMHLENMIIQQNEVVLLDTGTLMESLSQSGVPHGLPALDKYLMLTLLKSAAIEHGLPAEKTEKLIAKFTTGYKTTGPKLTPESEAFAALFYELFILDTNPTDSALFESTLASVNERFSPTIATDPALEIRRRHAKTLEAIFTKPRLSNILWDDIEALLLHLGAEITEAEGSRVHIALNGTSVTFHRPHPRKETDKGAVASMRTFLEKTGIK